jgi:DNA-binding MarR family transcriptional regulator
MYLSTNTPANGGAYSPAACPSQSGSNFVGLVDFAKAIQSLVRSDARDLSTRQLAVMTTLALEPDLNTVRGLAIHLRISKPAVTRALDRLEEEGLAKRRPDPADRRSVLLAILPAGRAFLDDIEIGLLKPTAEA